MVYLEIWDIAEKSSRLWITGNPSMFSFMISVFVILKFEILKEAG